MFKLIISLIFISTAILVFFTWSNPYWKDIQDLRAQEVSFNEALSNTRKIQEKQNALLDQYKTISPEDLDRINKTLPSKPNSIKFIMEMENILQKSGMILKTINVQDEEFGQKNDFPQKKDFNETRFSMKIVGSYETLRLLLKNLETNLRPVNITSLSFSVAEVNFYEYNIEASTYWKTNYEQ